MGEQVFVVCDMTQVMTCTRINNSDVTLRTSLVQCFERQATRRVLGSPPSQASPSPGKQKKRMSNTGHGHVPAGGLGCRR